MKWSAQSIEIFYFSQVWDKKKCLYYPAFKQLKSMTSPKYRRKTRRPDVEAPLPPETDINFLKELQFCRIEEQVQRHKENLNEERKVRVDAARATEELEECVCCCSDEVSRIHSGLFQCGESQVARKRALWLERSKSQKLSQPKSRVHRLSLDHARWLGQKQNTPNFYHIWMKDSVYLNR